VKVKFRDCIKLSRALVNLSKDFKKIHGALIWMTFVMKFCFIHMTDGVLMRGMSKGVAGKELKEHKALSVEYQNHWLQCCISRVVI
jgi:hypothetical protein